MIRYPVGAGGLQTRVIEEGHGPRCVLLLHGVGARADRWAPTVAQLAREGYRAMACDLPGHGFATKGAGPTYTAPGFAEFVNALLDELNVERAALVGTSLGAQVAATAALDRPDRARGLVLVGAVGLLPAPIEIVERVSESLRRTSRSDIEAKLRRVMADPQQVTEALIEEEWRINNSPGAAEAFAALSDYWRGGLNADAVGARLEGVDVHLIWGAQDPVTPPEMGREAAARLTGGVLHLIPGGAHTPYLDAPHIFHPLLSRLLASLPWDVTAPAT